MESLLELETPEQMQAALKEKGIELSEEEKCAIRELLLKADRGEIAPAQLKVWQKRSEDDELSEEALEQVAGGIGVTASIGIVAGTLIATMLVLNGMKKHGVKGFFKELASCFF